MSGDIRTMVWKELREFGRMGSNKAGGGFGMVWRLVIFVLLFGVFIPLRAGPSWVSSPFSLIPMLAVPLFMMMAMITDSFAGERERHTLETLLATRLSDQAILLGKIAGAATYAWARAIAYLAVGLITVNIVHGHGHLLMFEAKYLVGFLIFSLLLIVLVACAGVLVSLRASTVQQAARTLSLGFMGVAFGLSFLVGSKVVPEAWRLWLANEVMGASVLRTEVVLAVIIVIVDMMLYSAASVRFKRARLILD